MSQIPVPSPALSRREEQVIQMAAEGLTDLVIAQGLSIKLSTVRSYWNRMRQKMGPSNRAQLVASYTRLRNDEALESLRCENSHLLVEIETLDKEKHRLESAKAAFRALANLTTDAMFVVDEVGIVRAGNRAAAILFGYDEGELEGLSLSSLVPARFHGLHRHQREHYMLSPEMRTMGTQPGTTVVRKDGLEVPIVATLNTCESESGTLVVCLVREFRPNIR